jgi:hypothetical protein
MHEHVCLTQVICWTCKKRPPPYNMPPTRSVVASDVVVPVLAAIAGSLIKGPVVIAVSSALVDVACVCNGKITWVGAMKAVAAVVCGSADRLHFRFCFRPANKSVNKTISPLKFPLASPWLSVPLSVISGMPGARVVGGFVLCANSVRPKPVEAHALCVCNVNNMFGLWKERPAPSQNPTHLLR